MNIKVLIEGLLVFTISLIAIFEGLRLILYKDPYILYDPLGPGLYILALSFGLMAVAIFHFIVNYRKLPEMEKLQADGKMRNRLFSSIGILMIYILLVEFIGYMVGTFIFFFSELRVMGVKSWRINGILTLVLTAGYYIIFVKLCGMVFPKGIFF